MTFIIYLIGAVIIIGALTMLPLWRSAQQDKKKPPKPPKGGWKKFNDGDD